MALEIKQIRSRIGEKPKARGALRALGLRRINATVSRPATVSTYGEIRAVQHLVRCRMVPNELPSDVPVQTGDGDLTSSTYPVAGTSWPGIAFELGPEGRREYVKVESYPNEFDANLVSLRWNTPYSWVQIQQPITSLSTLLHSSGEVEFGSGLDLGVAPHVPYSLRGILQHVDARSMKEPPDMPVLVRLDASDHAMIWVAAEQGENSNKGFANTAGEFALLTTMNDSNYVRLLASITGSSVLLGHLEEVIERSAPAMDRLRNGHIRTRFG